jgi:NADH dehydrogenase FAD-containing subunit
MNDLREAARTAVFAVAAVRIALGPWLDLAVRLWLAQAFLVVQLHEMMAAPAPGGGLSAPLGPSWWLGALHGIMASGPGLVVQTICPLLLAVGLLSRPAALAMLMQVALLPGAGPDGRLFWTALLLRVALLGPGALSLDSLVRQGADSSALPGAALAGRAHARLLQWGGTAYLLGLRLWLALAPAGIALAALGMAGAMRPGALAWLPQVPPMVAALAPWAALGAATLLITGTATRLTALGLLVLVPLGQIAGAGDARLPWALVLTVLVVHGAGPVSGDGLLGGWLRRRRAPVDRAGLPHVVVVGGGFGGIAAVRGLRGAACRVTLLDKRNHHLFQPLLYQVATASLSPGDIATPVRALFRNQDGVRVLLGEVTGVDLPSKTVLLGEGRISYDHLVIATGARHGYLGHDEWAAFAPGLKTVEDGTAIRRRLLIAFEEAEGSANEEERRAWLTFVVVGGGPTGVELAGAIAELARHGLEEEFQGFDPASARILLVQSGKRLLPAFPESLSDAAAVALRGLGVEVVLGSRVESMDAAGVTMSGRRVPARTVLWAAGVMASPAAAWLGVEPDKAGRVKVCADLAVAGLDSVYAIGDTAASDGWDGKAVPGLAPAAKQGGAYVARVIRARLAGRPAPGAFRYRHLGSLATIGRQSAVADFGFLRVRGALAWWLWGAAHIAVLAGGRNRATVLVQWVWAYLTFRRGTRLITGE